VTSTHPVIDATGAAVAADELMQGDKVLTENGIATLVGVTREAYTGRVYTVALGAPEGAADTSGNAGGTLFANGFLMGDKNLQDKLAEGLKLQPGDLLARLPAAWHKDYQHSRLQQTER
jgi:hypothetical protein